MPGISHTHIGKIRDLNFLSVMCTYLEKEIACKHQCKYSNGSYQKVLYKPVRKNPLKSIFAASIMRDRI